MRRGPGYSFAGLLEFPAAVRAFGTGAKSSQEVPGVDAVLMAVVPAELDRVLADTAGLEGFRGGFEHRQGPGLGLLSLAWLALGLYAFLIAQCAGTGIAKVLKCVVALMTVLPGDIHAVAGREVHFHRLRVSRSRNLWGFYGHVISIA